MTEKDILYRCEQNFLNPDDEPDNAVECESCSCCEDLYNFDDEILCGDCIEIRLKQNSEECVAEFLDDNSEIFREFIEGYFDRISENQEV